jgi:hypothetical protein
VRKRIRFILAGALLALGLSAVPTSPAFAANSFTVTHNQFTMPCDTVRVTYTNLNEVLTDGTWTLRIQAQSSEVPPSETVLITIPDGSGDPDSGTFDYVVNGAGLRYNWLFPQVSEGGPIYSGSLLVMPCPD